MRLVLGYSGDPGLMSVERAIAEFRLARPVLVSDGDAEAIVIGVEDLDEELCRRLDVVAGGRARLILTGPRLRRLGLDREDHGAVAMPVVDPARVEALARRIDARIDAPVRAASQIDLDGLELARLALISPAVIVVPLPAEMEREPSILTVTGEDLRAFRRKQATRLRIASRAPVPLEGAPDTEFVVFRGGEGMRDQIAIIVGKPDLAKPVFVRLHSACLTGDLFGSLKCDCGDQLRGAVRAMAQADGGILLYLDQEGRGNGIANKIRAYKMQSEGFDTYDADAAMGFGLDQRRFDFAARMLSQLGVASVRVLTNNPLKIEALEAAGLDVVADERSIGRANPENLRYLAAKRDRAGHMIDLDAVFAAPHQD
ncbi:MAG: GTP cyclohydrolase II RibA [Salinarimonadaceae bacterium]|nr:MAG: GTP cyclohydrolase II RibA [Salinarimonadaceae bacterium]